MIDRADRGHCPTLAELETYTGSPAFMRFCSEIKARYGCTERMEFSACSWEFGWNIKFRAGGRSLCTLYPKEGFFTVLVVIGEKERPAVEALLPDCTPELRALYAQTPPGNGQRWLMIDLEDWDGHCADVFRLLDVRRGVKQR